MSDETTRLHLAQLVSLQELNAVTWNEALAQLDALVDLYLLGQFVNTPPANPNDGDAYLIGGAPTGAWTGYAYKIASCLDGAWRFYTPFNGLRAYVATSGAFVVYLNGAWVDWNSLISANEISIASAAICDLGAAGSLLVQVTGTTTITSFGAGSNKLRLVRFAQGLTLTHNAASLILLGGANRTTAAGDVGVYASDASGNWRERSYFRADGLPLAYSDGTFTPTLKFGGNSTGIVYVTRLGRYVKVGRQVTCSIYLLLSNKGSATGDAAIDGLPFATDSTQDLYQCQTWTYTDAMIFTGIPGSVTVWNSTSLLGRVVNGGTQSHLTNANFTNTTELRITFSYVSAA